MNEFVCCVLMAETQFCAPRIIVSKLGLYRKQNMWLQNGSVHALIIFGLEIVFLFRYSFFFVSLHLCVNSGRLPFSLQRRVILLVNDYSVGTEGFDLDRDIFWSGKSHMIGRFLTISDWLMGTQG